MFRKVIDYVRRIVHGPADAQVLAQIREAERTAVQRKAEKVKERAEAMGIYTDSYRR